MKKNILALFISSFVSLLFMELALRIVNPPLPTGVGTAQTPKAKLYGWAPPPHHREAIVNPDTGKAIFFKTNSQGWKDTEHALQKPEGVTRILFIGDSNTWGIVPLEDGYPRQIEKLLNERKSNVEVMNIAVGGWGTDQELEALQSEGLRYDPDIVIYQFSGNDIMDNITPYPNMPPDDYRWAKTFRYEFVNGALKKLKLKPKVTTTPSLPTKEKIKNFLLKSALVHNLNSAKNKIQGKDTKEKTNWWGRSPVDPRHPLYPYRSGNEPPQLQNAWELFEALVVKMKNIAGKQGAHFLIFSMEGDEGLRQFMIKMDYVHPGKETDHVVWDGRPYSVDLKKPLKNLEKICKKYNIPLMAPARIYERYENDTHANVTGNKSMARDIVDFLTTHGFLHP